MTLSTPVALRRWFRPDAPSRAAAAAAMRVFGASAELEAETCFVVSLDGELSARDERALEWLFAETFAPEALRSSSMFGSTGPTDLLTPEMGPRLSFQTAWGANAVSIARVCGVSSVRRIERFRRYRVTGVSSGVDRRATLDEFVAAAHDRMTEAAYKEPVSALVDDRAPAPTRSIPVLARGRAALAEANAEHGLGFDAQDEDYYLQLFTEMGRDPTDVELFDLAQSNSEHSRHWFFKGALEIDGVRVDRTLMDIVQDTLDENPRNSVIAFADNSSTIRGGPAPILRPARDPKLPEAGPGCYEVQTLDLDILYTAETHNFPCAVAPFPGAETGSGGRIRDTAATGRGSLVVGGTAGYAVGNLHIPGSPRAWEGDEGYPDRLASPLKILLDASDGASDYGNKFGEPVVAGFARSYGQRLPSGERREFVKPIMFSAGMGVMDHAHVEKGDPTVGLVVVKIGGPAYRIGLGGGAASSMVQGDNRDDLDFNAVQRGDAQMEQKAYRVLRACVEMGERNPIVSLHDQGAGGNCNVVKELIYPAGARIDLRSVWLGDPSLSALEIWGAEYQEQFGLLLRPESLPLFHALCAREGAVARELGTIDGSGRVVLWDSAQERAVEDLDLEKVLGSLPQKMFVDARVAPSSAPLEIPSGVTLGDALDRVLSLMSIGSKRFLTTKVDRSVTGLVAQQQTVGPLQLPLADAGVLATSHFGKTGSATAIGERPALTALSPAAMARMAVGEMMTNIAGVGLSARKDIKCEANWMWAAKLPGDGAALYDAAVAMRDVMIELGIAVDGGKDSLSMAARCPTPGGSGEEETVRAPGTLVISGYATVPNITRKLTPDIKAAGRSVLLHVDIARGKRRTGGSALAQVYAQAGDAAPDVDEPATLAAAFDVLQTLVAREGGDQMLLAYHDVSDGGVLVSALEMAFGGNCGIDVDLGASTLGVDVLAAAFAEELGGLVEVLADDAAAVMEKFNAADVPCRTIGRTLADRDVVVRDGSKQLLSASMTKLRDTWESTSFALEALQCSAACVSAEQSGLSSRTGPVYSIPYTPLATPASRLNASNKPLVAILRDEGSNGDREMASAFHLAGFSAWDVAMSDVRRGAVDLTRFRGVAFVGGFSHADALGSAKGWAGQLRFEEAAREQFEAFFDRPDTFSLGVCNGCQLMALAGAVPLPGAVKETSQPRFVENASGRYESRFVAVEVRESPAVMLEGMAGARLGVWVAHAEGRALFPEGSVLEEVQQRDLAPIRYIDDAGDVAEMYPFNPNGSPAGIAALCSPDGRHLAMMPHPERAVLPWQWAYAPEEADGWEVSPWMCMFQNAREWCERTADAKGA